MVGCYCWVMEMSPGMYLYVSLYIVNICVCIWVCFLSSFHFCPGILLTLPLLTKISHRDHISALHCHHWEAEPKWPHASQSRPINWKSKSLAVWNSFHSFFPGFSRVNPTNLKRVGVGSNQETAPKHLVFLKVPDLRVWSNHQLKTGVANPITYPLGVCCNPITPLDYHTKQRKPRKGVWSLCERIYMNSIACMQLRFLSVPARSKDAESSTSFCADHNTIWECCNASSRHEPSLNGSPEMSFHLLFVQKEKFIQCQLGIEQSLLHQLLSFPTRLECCE